MKRKIVYLLFVAIALLQGCIKEDMSTCNPELLLKYSYTLNKYNENLFGTEVNKINAFVFDENKLYYGTYTEQGDHLQNDWQMRIPLPIGKYSVVVWAGELSTYNTGELVDPSGTLSELRKGVTSIEDFMLIVKYAKSTQSHPEIIDRPDDLYHGVVYDALSDVNPTTGPTVHLTKNTHLLKIKVTGISNLPLGTSLDVFATAANGRYKHDNNVGEHALTIKYPQLHTELGDDVMKVDLTVLRLMIGRSPMLIVADHKNPDKPLYKQNIIDAILQHPDYKNQRDIDREDEFEFEINLNKDLTITVTVNGWTVEHIYPGL